jgi:NUMOD4 motif/AP2 domain
MIEVWADVEDFPNYQISTVGRVRSRVTCTNTRVGKILRPYIDRYGYLRISLFRTNKRFHRLIHILVAKAFVPNLAPDILVQVNHKNGDRTDPNVFNLEWRTALGNQRHAVKTRQNGAKGVYFQKRDGNWRAYYNPMSGKRKYIGTFLTEQAALAARNSAIDALEMVV